VQSVGGCIIFHCSGHAYQSIHGTRGLGHVHVPIGNDRCRVQWCLYTGAGCQCSNAANWQTFCPLGNGPRMLAMMAQDLHVKHFR